MKNRDLSTRLRHRITFESPTETRDSDGVASVVWATVYIPITGYRGRLESVPAEVLTGPGREFLASGQIQAEIAIRVTCRWFPGLNAAWRIVWDGQVYNIHSWETDNTGRREYRIRCVTGVNEG